MNIDILRTNTNSNECNDGLRGVTRIDNITSYFKAI